MTEQRSAAIKDYIYKTFVQEDECLLQTKKHAHAEGLPEISIPENVGKLLYILTKLRKPRRILEIGTLAGYSTLWFAKAAPKAKIFTLESNPTHSKIAQKNFQQAAYAKNITLIEGDALKTLKSFKESGEPPFDLIFLDADRKVYPTYFPYLLAVADEETLLLTDNLIPKESAINRPESTDIDATNTYHYNQMLALHPSLETILATTIVGQRGRVDALGISLVRHKI